MCSRMLSAAAETPGRLPARALERARERGLGGIADGRSNLGDGEIRPGEERRGTILNVASTVAFQPSPYMSAYGATKAFVLSLSEALWAEYRGRGLHVAAVCPGPVETPFIDAMGAGVRSTVVFRMALSVDDVVRACLRALDGKQPTRIVGFMNWLLAQTSRFSPRALTARVSAAMFAPRSKSARTP